MTQPTTTYSVFLVEEDFPATIQEFEKRFGTEAACKEYLFSLRWPKGFVCPSCAHRMLWRMADGRYLCRMCRYQVSITAGTIFQYSKLPLAVWFRAMWYITRTTSNAGGGKASDLRNFTSVESSLYPELSSHYENVFDDWEAENTKE